MPEKYFNLIDEPWILVLDEQGDMQKVSLERLFANAHKYKRLAGELPTQDISIFRMLLAILYAVIAPRNEKTGQVSGFQTVNEALERWQELWKEKKLPFEDMQAYLSYFRDRFYLFHPQTPFYQVAPCYTQDSGITPMDTILMMADSSKSKNMFEGNVVQSDNQARQFPMKNTFEPLQLDEAARWLIHINAFDISPAGAPKVGKIQGYKQPWPSGLGLVYVEGSNLFESLLLNLVLVGENQAVLEIGVPCWEEELPGRSIYLNKMKSVALSPPRGICELLTAQFRIGLLKCENQRVTNYQIFSGKRYDVANLFLEQMTLWEQDAKEKKRAVFVPRRHEITRQLWRGLSSLLASEVGSRMPGVIYWIELLTEGGKVERRQIKVNAIGADYGPKASSISHIYSDSVVINNEIVSGTHSEWNYLISKTLEIIARYVDQLGDLAGKLAEAKGLPKYRKVNNRKVLAVEYSAVVRQIQEEAYFGLDAKFRRWLATIDTSVTEREEKALEFLDIAKREIREEGYRLVAQSDPCVLVGREVRNFRDQSVLRNAPLAFNEFKFGLARISNTKPLEGGKNDK